VTPSRSRVSATCSANAPSRRSGRGWDQPEPARPKPARSGANSRRADSLSVRRSGYQPSRLRPMPCSRTTGRPVPVAR
jgi:hypothetical protein